MIERLPRTGALILVALSLLIAGCSGETTDSSDGAGTSAGSENEPASAPDCPADWEASWQKLANRIGAPVYCPSWLPDPLTGELGGPWNRSTSVKDDGSYLMGFLHYEFHLAEVHVNLRAYPGRTKIPSCNGEPCFEDPREQKELAGLDIQMYTRNQGADTWHVLYAWQQDGSLYTVSEHVAPPFTYAQVVENLDRIVRGLMLVEPTQT